jgi:esterase/lipase superfamily enzyme
MSRLRNLGPTLAVLLLASTSSQTVAQGQRLLQRGRQQTVSVHIVGTLDDDQGSPISGARIGLALWSGTAWQPITVSSKTGAYEVRTRLQRGTYRVIAAFGRYELTSSFFEARDNRNMRIDLVPDRDTAKSDYPPTETPPVAMLPEGSFPPSPPPPILPAPPPPPPPPPPANPGNQEYVTVFYFTNREILASQPGRFAEYASSTGTTRYGTCTVSIPPTHEPGKIERPEIWRFERVEDVNKHIVITREEVLPGEQAFRARLHQAFGQSVSEAFLFVHGYNVEFDDAVRRTAQLFRDLKFNGVPILFSWPGQDAWWRYPAAEDAVDASARVLEQFIVNTLATEKLSAVNVIAHSLGNRVLTRALEDLALRRANAQFNDIVLAAPDVNVVDFDAISKVLRSSSKRATIYSSSRDVALQISKEFHSYARLGEAPPQVLSSQIDTIDTSAIPQDDILGHSYFGDSSTVLRDIFLLVMSGLDPAKRFLEPRVHGGYQYWAVPR